MTLRIPLFVLASALILTATSAATPPSAKIIVDADGVLGPEDGFRVKCETDVNITLGEALDDAIASGCLDSMETTTFTFGRFIDCINDLCNDFGSLPLGADGRFWIIYENLQSASFGIDDLQVDAGDVFHISYDLCPVAACVPNWALP